MNCAEEIGETIPEIAYELNDIRIEEHIIIVPEP
jgi:hypothetical protein